MVGTADRMLDLVVAQIGSELVVPGPADELTAAVGQDFLRERQTRDDIAVDDDQWPAERSGESRKWSG